MSGCGGKLISATRMSRVAVQWQEYGLEAPIVLDAFGLRGGLGDMDDQQSESKERKGRKSVGQSTFSIAMEALGGGTVIALILFGIARCAGLR